MCTNATYILGRARTEAVAETSDLRPGSKLESVKEASSITERSMRDVERARFMTRAAALHKLEEVEIITQYLVCLFDFVK